jgi:hypothetical protein
VRQIYTQRAANRHFERRRYAGTLRIIGDRIGLISNSHRCPRRSKATSPKGHQRCRVVVGPIHETASEHLRWRWVDRCAAQESVMVGQSDARHRWRTAGRHAGILVRRSADILARPPVPDSGVPIVRSLTELPALL